MPYDVDYHYINTGCSECHYTGYKGRKAIYEVIPIDSELSSMIRNDVLPSKELLKAKGLKTLAENAFVLMASGLTTIEEIYPLLNDQHY